MLQADLQKCDVREEKKSGDTVELFQCGHRVENEKKRTQLENGDIRRVLFVGNLA